LLGHLLHDGVGHSEHEVLEWIHHDVGISSGGCCPTERGFAWELLEASCILGGIGASIVGAWSLQALAHVTSLTTIVPHSLPTNTAKSVARENLPLFHPPSNIL